MNINNDKIFAKGEDGHYRYYDKSELNKKNSGIKKLIYLFYVLIIIVIISSVYLLYIDKYRMYLREKEIIIDNGNIYQIELLPKNSKYFNYDNYIFKTEDEKIAQVDRYGQVTGVNNGETLINVRFKHGFESEKLKVTIDNVEVKSIDVPKEIIVDKNDTQKVEVKVNSKDNVSTKIIYKSEDESVVKIDDFGNIVGIEEGQTNIIVETPDGQTKDVKVIIQTEDKEIQEISINEKNIQIKVGEQRKLSVTTVPNNASLNGLVWTSENPDIVGIDQKGNIKALKEGNTKISVKTETGLQAMTSITVLKEEELILNSYNEKLMLGEYVKLNANKSVNWSSSDTKIAIVDQKGNVKAVGVGSTKITATSNNGKIVTCNIIVEKENLEPTTESIPQLEEILPTKVTFETTNLTLTEDDIKKIKVTISPLTATNKSVTYSSSNPKVATVDQKGNVKAVGVGIAKITAVSKTAKEIKADIIVTVNAKTIAMDNMTINKTSLQMYTNSTSTLSVLFTPSNATNKTVTWSSSNPKVATVDQKGNVKAVAVGSTKITAKSSNGKTSSCNISVSNPVVKVSSIKISSSITSLYVEETAKLTATINPSNATNKTVTWSSSNPKVATIDQYGNIKGIKSGSVKVTASSQENNNKSSSISIIIKEKPIKLTNINLSCNETTIKEGESLKLTATISPNNATDKTLKWNATNTNTISVDQKGNVKGLKAGESYVEVYSSDKKIKSRCKIIVNENVLVQSIKMNSEFITTEVNKTHQLSATIIPSNATDKKITYSSNNSSVASVDQNGKVTAKKQGVAIITAKSSNGKSDSVNITVEGRVSISSFGAKCDGKNDDTNAISTAIKFANENNIETINMGNGNCKITKKIALSCKTGNMTIIGNATITHHNITFLSIGSNCKNVKLNNITSISTYNSYNRDINNDGIVDNKDSITHIAGHDKGLNLSLNNVTLDGAVTGISLNNLNSLIIDKSTFKNMKFVPEYGRGGYGILVQGSKNVKITNSKFIANPFFRHAIYISVSQAYPENRNVEINKCIFDYSGLTQIDYTKYNYPKDKMYRISESKIWSPDTSPIQFRKTNGVKIINSTFINTPSSVVLLGENGPINNVLMQNLTIKNPVLRKTEFNNGFYFKGSVNGGITGIVDNLKIENAPADFKYGTVFYNSNVIFKNVPTNSPALVDLGYGTKISGFTGKIETPNN